ncbi:MULTISPECIES: KilA-N domain-containing protein [unclassified Tatumella]|uniref:KilA-N domain-containing protein n=1 Tax=unclassified Tatumella TaxID=2649542 RepID=UPI001BAEDAEB|nr:MULTISPECIES: KilA-N domain-containing protein [unclassified Tatumella]MBS0854961.1 KilA-N domain-containing protein [Tatumella sp. JGM16]MBS0912077.1 KilA-N domain-containing protein [Tatumella sp. JGM91]
MQYPTVKVNGISVRVDEDGRYCLNDLHAAAVKNGEATESQKPGKFIRSASVQRFIRALERRGQKRPHDKSQVVLIVEGGVNKGIWGVEMIAVRYAAWIKPEFEIDVYNTFIESRTNALDILNQLNRLDYLISGETKEISQCARKMGKWGSGGRKALLNEARQNLIDQIDPDMVALMDKAVV